MTARSEEQLHMFGGEPERLGHPLFSEKWSNRKCFMIGLYTGQGMSAPAIEKALGEQDTANTIAHMVNVWGYRLDGERHTHATVRVPLAAAHRTTLANEALRRDITMPELTRRLLVQIAQDGDTLFPAILDL
jgi:hypothetical protein